MSTPDTSIDPRILTSAKKAFLKYGYQNAQLKEICQDAAVTTGALYKRYKGKDDLFRALVQNAVDDINMIVKQREDQDPKLLTNEELYQSWMMESPKENSWSMQNWFNFLYHRKDEFTLLLSCSEGSQYSGFIRNWVNRMTDGCYLYLEEASRRNMVDHPVSKAELAVILSAFWTTISEPFLAQFSKEELDQHCKIVCQIFQFEKIFSLHMPD